MVIIVDTCNLQTPRRKAFVSLPLHIPDDPRYSAGQCYNNNNITIISNNNNNNNNITVDEFIITLIQSLLLTWR